MKRYLSRKFILAAAAQATGLAVLIWPSHADALAAAIESAAGLAIVLLASLGYLAAESSIDRAGAGRADEGAAAAGEGAA